MSLPITTGLIIIIIGTVITTIITITSDDSGVFWLGEIVSVIAGIIAGLILKWTANPIGVGFCIFALISIIFIIGAISEKNWGIFVVGLLVSAIISAGVWWGTNKLIATFPADTITFAGKIVDSTDAKWRNDRVIVVYRNNKEVGRGISTQGNFEENGLGFIDGLFIIEIPNEYKFSLNSLNSETAPFEFSFTQKTPSFFTSYSTYYHWFPEIAEGSKTSIHIKSKDIDYVIMVLDGEVKDLPPEITNENSVTELRNGSVFVVLSNLKPEAANEENTSYQIQNLNTSVNIEKVESSQIKLPLDNCSGTSVLTNKYSKNQSFVHQYTGEFGLKIGAEIPANAWLKLLPELQGKYGFENGQVDTIIIESTFQVEPHSKVIYTINLSEVWESGSATMTDGINIIEVPFRVKKDLLYEITSSPDTCP